MRELSLFSGAGGGIYGSKILGWKTLGYVEWDSYCQKVIAQRIKDGIFDEAPIFGDVRTFVSEGYARKYRGMVDIVTGGFPCQPFSVAGKQLAEKDDRNMWPATCEVIKAVRPRVVYFENTPGLVSTGYIVTVIKDLERIGYRVKRPLYLGADDVGAIHHRQRVWIYATDSENKQSNGARPKTSERSRSQAKQPRNSGVEVLHSNARGERGQRLKQKTLSRQCGIPWSQDIRSLADLRNRPDLPEPIIWGGNDGMAHRRNRTRAIGNGQVPLTMATAYAILSSEAYQ